MKRTPIGWPASRVETLYLRFKQNIIDRTWPPDEALNIDRLALECGVSITPVREALARLTADKLVVALPNKGYRVAPPPGPERFADIAGVRLLLEPFAARAAALRINARGGAELRRVHERIAELHTTASFENIQAFTTLNRAFHEHVFRLSGNQVLVHLYEQLGYHVVVGHHHHVYGIPDLPEVVAEHAAIVEALARRDPDAAEAAMRTHVERGSRLISAAYRETASGSPPESSPHRPDVIATPPPPVEARPSKERSTATFKRARARS